MCRRRRARRREIACSSANTCAAVGRIENWCAQHQRMSAIRSPSKLASFSTVGSLVRVGAAGALLPLVSSAAVAPAVVLAPVPAAVLAEAGVASGRSWIFGSAMRRSRSRISDLSTSPYGRP